MEIRPVPSPRTAEELAAAILSVIRRYREPQAGGARTDVALALAIADRENFRLRIADRTSRRARGGLAVTHDAAGARR